MLIFGLFKKKHNKKNGAILKKMCPVLNSIEIVIAKKLNFVTQQEYYKTLKIKEKAKKSLRKSRIWNILSVLINVGIILMVVLTQYNNGPNMPFTELISRPIKWGFILLALLMPVVLILSRTIKTAFLIKKPTEKINFNLSYRTTAITKYYNDITPFASGGQPVQIFYLNKNGLDSNISASVPLINYIFWQLAYVIISLVVILSNTMFYAQNVVASSIIWISFAVNLSILIGIFIVAMSKRIVPIIVTNFLKFLTKIKIIRNYNKYFNKSMSAIIKCQKTIRYFASNFKTIILQISCAFVEIISINLVPYFIYLAFIPNPTLPAFEIITGAVLCQMISSVTPTPGGSGGAEFMFITLFGTAFESIGIIWPVLFWRFFTYYIFIFQGIIVTFTESIKNDMKQKHKIKSIKNTVKN